MSPAGDTVASNSHCAPHLSNNRQAHNILAGYSKTPLIRKLGIKPNHVLAFVNAPDRYTDTLGELPGGAVLRKRLTRNLDFCQVFCAGRRDLNRRAPAAVRALGRDGTLWLCWPKKSSGLQTDLGEADIRAFGLQRGLVDVKICAVDETWSGLKFVYRLKDR